MTSSGKVETAGTEHKRHIDFSRSNRWLALVNVCLGQFISAVDIRSVNVALPTLAVYFGTSMAVVQWIILAYQITIISLVLSLGRLGDAIGRKKIYNLGFIIFMLGSALCALATGMASMIFFRVFEAIGAAMVLANGRAIASAVFGSEQRGRALGITSMAFHIGYIIGPSLGGFLIDSLGWRWIFLVNLPVAFAGAVMAWKVLQETVAARRRYDIDPPGVITMVLTVVSLILGLHENTGSGFSYLAVSLFLISALSLALFIYFERRCEAPLLDLALFRNRLFAAGIISQFLFSLAQTATFFLLPFYLQGILSFTPTKTGLTMIVYSVVIVLLAPVGGSLSDKLGSRLLCTLGCLCTFLSVLSMAWLHSASTQLSVMIPLMGIGLGWSLFASPNLSAIFGSVAPDRLGAVSGISLTTANVANGVGVALASLLYVQWLGYYGVTVKQSTSYAEWAKDPSVFMTAFQNSWMFFALLVFIAVITSAMRGRK